MLPRLQRRLPRPALNGYVVAVLMVGAAVLLRAALDPLLHQKAPLLVFVLSVVGAALYGGFAVGLTATGLSVIAIDALFMEPRLNLLRHDGSDFASLALFAAVGVTTSTLVHRLHRANRAASERQHQIDLATTAGRVGIFELHLATGKVVWTEQMEQLFEIAPGTFEGDRPAWEKRIHPEDRERARTIIDTCVEKRQPECNFEFRTALPGGRTRWLAARARLFLNAAGSPERMLGAAIDVTEIRESQEALRREQRLLDAILKTTDVMLVYLDPSFNFVSVNPAYAASCKMSPEQMIGKNHFELYPNAENEAIFRRVRDTGEPVFFKDKPFEYPDQPERGVTYWDWSLTAVKDRTGKVAGLVFTLRETTKYKKAEEELWQASQRYQLALGAAGLGAWDARLDTGEFLWDERCRNMWGIPTGGRIGFWESVERIHPEDRAGTEEAIRQAIAGADSGAYHREFRLVWPDGSTHWVASHGRVHFEGEGESRRAVRFLGVNMDITDAKLAEERVRHQNAALEGMNRILREALSSDTEEELGRTCLAVAEGVTQSKFGLIAEIGGDGRLNEIAISEAGRSACRMEGAGDRKPPAGLAIHGIFGRVVHDGKGFFTNDPASCPDSIGVPAGHPPLTAFLGVPLVHSGRTIGLMAVANREEGYRQQDLDTLGALAAAVVQVFMRKRAERALRDGEERLRQAQKLESIGVLAGGVAHDFNNLLTSILGNASLAQLDAPSKITGQLDSIVEAAQRAAGLTRQLLAYAGKGRFEITDFDMSRVIRSSADLLRVSTPKNVELILDVPRRLPPIRGDSVQIQQVVMNLVINASEAIGNAHNGTVSISAAVEDIGLNAPVTPGFELAPGRYVSLRVRDNGCGMDEATKAKMFDPFFTTKFTGRGLGLAAVHGILRSHKGGIAVRSRSGEGSEFTVYLPCAAPRASGSPSKDAGVGGQRAATVIVVDDEPSVRNFAKAALERVGHTVLLAENGHQALKILSAGGTVNLVLLDVVMPVIGGGEVLAEIRKQWPEIAVLVTSGYNREEACRLGSLPPDVPYIEKPYTLRKLAAAVHKTLESRTLP